MAVNQRQGQAAGRCRFCSAECSGNGVNRMGRNGGPGPHQMPGAGCRPGQSAPSQPAARRNVPFGRTPLGPLPVISGMGTPLRLLSAPASAAPYLGMIRALPRLRAQGAALLQLYQMMQNVQSSEAADGEKEP